MAASISPISQIPLPSAGGAAAKSSSGAGFGSVLNDAINQVETSQATASESVQRFLSGESQELHSTILATQEASLQFDLLLQVRNKVVQAYQEVMRMQI